ncbi:MAG: phosphocholine cytidylyltransferase family protein [Cyclobacteriaceae bacterium]
MTKTAVILAAGRGMRLRPHTHEIPKGLLQVGKEKLVERSVRVLQSKGIKNIILGTGHLSEQYEAFAKKHGFVTYLNEDFATTGSFHTLCCGKETIKDDFLLLESDLLYDSVAIDRILDTEEKDVILCSGFTQSNDEVYVETSEGYLKNLSKDPAALNHVDAELVGIWKISQLLFQKLLEHHKVAEDARSKDYEKAIADIADSYPVKMCLIEDLTWCEIDDEAHLERARKKILPKLT